MTARCWSGRDTDLWRAAFYTAIPTNIRNERNK